MNTQSSGDMPFSGEMVVTKEEQERMAELLKNPPKPNAETVVISGEELMQVLPKADKNRNKPKSTWEHIEAMREEHRKTLDIYVESDSRKRALKVASERYGAIIAGEQTMYPYLRVGVLRHYSNMVPAFFDFKTGEMVLFDREELAVELPDFIKVRRAEPLKKR